MPANHLRALIAELHPGVSVRRLTLAAGLDPNRIAYYLKPSTHIDQMPKLQALEEVARALDCDLLLVAEAFAADAGLPWGPDQPDDPGLGALVRAYQRLGAAGKRRMREAAAALADPGLAAVIDAYQRLSPADRRHLKRVAEALADDPSRANGAA